MKRVLRKLEADIKKLRKEYVPSWHIYECGFIDGKLDVVEKILTWVKERIERVSSKGVKIVIEVSGGVVVGVKSNTRIKFTLVDYDINSSAEIPSAFKDCKDSEVFYY